MTLQNVGLPVILQGAALVCFVWSLVVLTVQAVGIFQLVRYFSSPPPEPVSPALRKDEVPHVTIIRPVKGWEEGWHECLASTFRQAYPKDKQTVYLCASSADDPSLPFLEKLLVEFSDFDASILIEEQDPMLHGSDGKVDNLGPNPKVRNISRAYREAKGDIIWIVDANVWISKGVAGRMVDKLCGFRPDGRRAKPFKFVHQLPIVVDMGAAMPLSDNPSQSSSWSSFWGGRLDEMFMATTHAKFYSAINTVGIAPCILGKSNMFRKSHLDSLTDPAQNPLLSVSASNRGRGIDFFSSYICEDHLIGDLLWRSSIPGFSNHGLVFGDLAIQPTIRMSVSDYVGRRVRWLRVRKWTVIVATLVEPGVESLLCCTYLSFSLTTLSWFQSVVPQTWTAMIGLWLAAVLAWMLLDRQVSRHLLRCWSVEQVKHMPSFARGVGRPGGVPARAFLPWLAAWMGRELLALPIWIWAVLLGTTVVWRGKKFTVRMDMSVLEIPPPSRAALEQQTTAGRDGLQRASRSKRRVD